MLLFHLKWIVYIDRYQNIKESCNKHYNKRRYFK